MGSRTKCDAEDHKYQNGNGNTKSGTMPEIKTVDHLACNGVIHTLDEVMFPVSLSQLEVEAESESSDDSGDMSNVTASKGIVEAYTQSVLNAVGAYTPTVPIVNVGALIPNVPPIPPIPPIPIVAQVGAWATSF